MAAIGATLYMVGGEQMSTTDSTSSIHSKNLRAYDTAKGIAWDMAPALFFHRVNRAVTVNGKIYSMGGQDLSGSSTNFVEMWDPDTSMWTGLASMPVTNWNLSVAAVGGTIYALIGNELRAYDTNTDTWSTMHRLGLTGPGEGAQLNNPSMAAIGASLFVAGGETSGGSYSNTLWIYSTDTDTWSRGPSLPVVLSQPAAYAFNGNFYLMGGDNHDGDWHPHAVWEYELGNHRWIERAKPNGETTGAQAVVIGNTVYVAGGCCIDRYIYAGYADNPPVLSWAGVEHFEAKGVYPEVSRGGESITFKVKYSHPDGIPPDEVRIFVLKGGSQIWNQQLNRDPGGDFLNGAVYSFSWVFGNTGETYTHYFAAKDQYGAVATGNPANVTVSLPGPSFSDGVLVPGDLLDNLPDPGKIQVRNNILKMAEGGHSYLVVRTVKARGKFSAKLYSSAGQPVASLTDGEVETESSGIKSVEISGLLKGKPLPSGLYWVVVTGDAKGKAAVVIMSGK